VYYTYFLTRSGYTGMDKNISFKELVELVNKICNPKLSDEEVSVYIEILEINVLRTRISRTLNGYIPF
jgi:hypothetical protein